MRLYRLCVFRGLVAMILHKLCVFRGSGGHEIV